MIFKILLIIGISILINTGLSQFASLIATEEQKKGSKDLGYFGKMIHMLEKNSQNQSLSNIIIIIISGLAAYISCKIMK
tara:strand:+ start:2740 stop:2976 length:237 start_codon:yes stop_codon:yes gene_type:complete